MPFDAKSFCENYNILWFPPGSKNVHEGWIGIQCPFCPDPSSHGGFNIKKEFYSCWRCGGHWMPKVIATLVKTDIPQAKKLIKKYSSGKSSHIKKSTTKHKYVSKIIFPPGTGPLTDKAKQYLINRNFDPSHLASEWGLLSTGHIGEYKFRILVPIYLRGQLISYQCRDITDKNPTLYKGCPIEESVYSHKHSLYGIDKAAPRKRCVVVEGVADVWRLGPGAIATFGIKFTPQQILILIRNFDEVSILYDTEDQAQEQADKLFQQIIGYGKQARIFSLPDKINDPGDLSDDDAKALMKNLGI